jgi:hypothetical protein
LIRDLREFKTLPQFTLRRLGSLNLAPDSPGEVEDFKAELDFLRNNWGEDYLDIIEKRLGLLKSEIIIAVENQKRFSSHLPGDMMSRSQLEAMQQKSISLGETHQLFETRLPGDSTTDAPPPMEEDDQKK